MGSSKGRIRSFLPAGILISLLCLSLLVDSSRKQGHPKNLQQVMCEALNKADSMTEESRILEVGTSLE